MEKNAQHNPEFKPKKKACVFYLILLILLEDKFQVAQIDCQTMQRRQEEVYSNPINKGEFAKRSAICAGQGL